MKVKVLSIFTLLLMAATGAVAQTETLLTTITATGKEQANYSTANVATVSFSYTAYGSSAYSDNWGWWGYGWSATVTAAEGYTITKCVFYDDANDANRTATDSEAPFVVETTEEDKTPRINGTPIDGGNMWSKGIKTIEVYGYVTPAAPTEPDVEVTTNAAEEGATFTEASFAMPAFDATAEYELVRDMGYKVAFSGVPTRARLAKDGDGKFHFADGLTFQLLDNIDAANPKDITSAEGITFMVGEVEAVVFEGNTFYQLNKETLVPLADFLADAHLGNYAICAVASTGEYDGSFASGRIELFQGYEVEVAAKEFITYYKDEPLYVEDEAAELYTIESVNGDQAVLSDRSDAMPSNTPMLVYNKSNETKVILLIPCAEPDMAITVAPEFQGTLNATTIAASTEGQTNYAFNGKAFVFVKNAIEVGPNKAWLSVNTGEPSARITLVFDEATGVGSIENGKLTIDNWYDLNGRKLQGMPTKKGVYIMNGRKVVVK